MSAAEEPAAGQDTAPLLEVNNIEVIYDHVILVLRGVSLQLPQGGIVALLGGNGAGKTTTLKAISNLLGVERGEVTKGSITFKGDAIEALNPNELVKRGVIQVMEGRHCFEHLTVEENLLTGAYTRGGDRAGIARDLEIYDYFPRLKERRRALAGHPRARTTDVRDWPRLDEPAEHHLAGRTLHGPGPAIGRADLRDREKDQ